MTLKITSNALNTSIFCGKLVENSNSNSRYPQYERYHADKVNAKLENFTQQYIEHFLQQTNIVHIQPNLQSH